MIPGRRSAARLALGGTALAFSAAAIASLVRTLSEFREYVALRASDPSGAEVYLDGAYIWGAASLVSLLVVAGCLWGALRRKS